MNVHQLNLNQRTARVKPRSSAACLVAVLCLMAGLIMGTGCAVDHNRAVKTAMVCCRCDGKSPYLFVKKDAGGKTWSTELFYLPDQPGNVAGLADSLHYTLQSPRCVNFDFEDAILTRVPANAGVPVISAAVVKAAWLRASQMHSRDLPHLLKNADVALFKLALVSAPGDVRETNQVWAVLGGSASRAQ